MANRTIRLYKNYFKDFYLDQNDSVRNKINYCLNMVKTLDRVPVNILKFIEGTEGLYEIRIKVGNQKKTQKTPSREIEKAMQIMKEYYNEKKNGKDEN